MIDLQSMYNAKLDPLFPYLREAQHSNYYVDISSAGPLHCKFNIQLRGSSLASLIKVIFLS